MSSLYDLDYNELIKKMYIDLTNKYNTYKYNDGLEFIIFIKDAVSVIIGIFIILETVTIIILIPIQNTITIIIIIICNTATMSSSSSFK